MHLKIVEILLVLLVSAGLPSNSSELITQPSVSIHQQADGNTGADPGG